MGKADGRSYANLKYKLIKKLRNKANDYYDLAKTKEEKEAWGMVVCWFESFLSPEFRVFTKTKAIGLKIDIRKMSRILDNENF